MKFNTATLVLLVGVVSFVRANNIRCLSCDDCTKEEPAIVKCSAQNGIDVNALAYNPTYPMLTQSTPAWGNPWDPWNPILTPPPLVGGNNGGGYPWDPWNPNLTPPPLVGGNNGGGYPWDPWNPILTPPPLVGGNNGGGYPWDPWNPILTPPPVWYPAYRNGKAHKPPTPQKRFVCITIKSQGKDRSTEIVHRRGCAEIEGFAAGVCEHEQIPLVDGGITSCRVCGHSLCNE